LRKTAAIATLAVIFAFGGLAGTARPVAAQGAGSSMTGASIVQTALKYLGAAFSNGNGARFPSTGFSDIGFVVYVYNQNAIYLHINWARMEGDRAATYDRILRDGPHVKMSNLQPGDVIYFKDTVWAGLSHIGIYVGSGTFVHAEWYNRGVVLTSFNNDPVDGNYWAGKYLTANRPWKSA
jgi:cell wall-associated NlpC family hydrolase